MRIREKERPGWLARFIYWYAQRLYPVIPEPLKVLAHHPAVMFGNGIYELAQERATRVEPRLKKLAQLQVARLVGCPW